MLNNELLDDIEEAVGVIADHDTVEDFCEEIKNIIVVLRPEIAKILLEFMIEYVLDPLAEDDFWGTEGWEHRFGMYKTERTKMERFYRPITPYEMIRNTSQSLKQVEHILELAGKFAMDMQKTDRTGEKNNKCICCFYSSRIAGAAITISHCGICGEKLMAGSTDTNRLCLACAKEHDLCEHCGGDVNLKPNRKKWPQNSVQAKSEESRI